MHGCYQIGSSEGVALHCLKILNNIFHDFEKKYLKSVEINVKDNLEVRAEKISGKCSYFKPLSEDLKSLGGTVTFIIHGNIEEFIEKKLVISEKDFKILNDIITEFSKVYDLEFNVFSRIRNDKI